MVVYTTDAATNIQTDDAYDIVNNNIENHASVMIANLNVGIAQNELNDEVNFTVAGTTTAPNYDESSTTPPDEGNLFGPIVSDFNNMPQSIAVGPNGGQNLEALRTQAGADIVVVVARPSFPDPTPEDPNNREYTCCGAAELMLGNGDGQVTSADSNENRPTTAVDPMSVFTDSLLHEIGHLGGVVHAEETVLVPVLPEARGFFVRRADGSVASCTIMTNSPLCPAIRPIFSSPDRVLFDFENPNNFPLPAGDDDHNAISVLEQTLPLLGDYADRRANPPQPPPPPARPNVRSEFIQCDFNRVGEFVITWWPSSSEDIVASIEVEYNTDGVWRDYYEGEGSCVPYFNDLNTDFRAKAVNSSGSSAYAYFHTRPNCPQYPEHPGLF